MLEVRFSDADDDFTAAEQAVIVAVAERAELLTRSRLPALRETIRLEVRASTAVLELTGEVGFAESPSTIWWRVDPSRDAATVARSSLLHTFLHEAHHAVRLIRYPSMLSSDWYDNAIFEGLATVFERDEADFVPPWGEYPDDEIEAWADELFSQPIDEHFNEWKFEHPDGRQWIAYRVGAWVVDRAVAESGRSAADLVWESNEAIVRMAGLGYYPVAARL
jgi:hypothetical protein